MADQRISQLGALAEAPAAGDLLAIVDVSDTTDSAQGTTKQITSDNVRSGLAPLTQAINAQTGTTYTLALSDAGKLVTLDNAAAVTLTVPKNSVIAFPVGSRVDLAGIGAGIVTIAPVDGDVTVNATPSLVFEDRYSSASLVKLATNTWLAVGRLA